MKNNTKKTLANYVASVETTNTNNKEDKGMDNTTNVMVTFEGKEISEKNDLMALTIAQLNELSRSFGLNGYPKKTRKLEIVSMLWDDLCDLADEKREFEKTCAEVVEATVTVGTPSQYRRGEVDAIDWNKDYTHPVVEESVVVEEKEKKEEETMVEVKFNEGLLKAVAKHLVEMSRDKQYAYDHGSTSNTTWKLFYTSGNGQYSVQTKRLKEEVENAIAAYNKTPGVSWEWRDKVIKELVNRGFMTLRKIHFWTFKKPGLLCQEAKDQLNTFCLNGAMKPTIYKDGAIRVDCTNDEAVEWLNNFVDPDHVFISITATSAQLNAMYMFMQ